MAQKLSEKYIWAGCERRKAMSEEITKKLEIEKGSMSEPEAQKMVEGGKWYSVKQIADKLGYSSAWIAALLEQKRIKGVKPLGGRWRIPPEEFERLLKEGIPPLPREAPKPPVREVIVPKAAQDKVSPPSPAPKQGKKFPWSLFEV